MKKLIICIFLFLSSFTFAQLQKDTASLSIALTSYSSLHTTTFQNGFLSLGPSLILQVNHVSIQLGLFYDLKPYYTYTYSKATFWSEKSYSPHKLVLLSTHYNFSSCSKLDFFACIDLISDTRTIFTSSQTEIYLAIGLGGQYHLSRSILLRLSPGVQFSQRSDLVFCADICYAFLFNKIN